MKEEKQIRIRRKSFKGSVLFTVVAVMMVMIVFVLATLTIAGAANKRAYASYSKNQTTYTARAAVESVYKALTDENAKDFGKKINAITTTTPGEIEVSGFDASMGSVGYYDTSGNFVEGKILVELLPNTIEQEVWDKDEHTIVAPDEKDVLRITATSSLAGEDSTVSLYVIKNPEDPPATSSFGGALTTMGGYASNSAAVSYGGATLNLKASKWDTSTNDYIHTQMINNSTITSDIYCVGTLDVNSGIKTYFEKEGQGFVVLGDLKVNQDNGLQFSSNVSGNTITDYNKIPYIYVERMFKPQVTNNSEIGSASNPINIYVGGYIYTGFNSNVSFNSDIYIYNKDIQNNTYYDAVLDENGNWNGDKWDENYPLSRFYNNGSSKLIDWTTSLLNNSTNLRQVGGNLYSKGSVDFGSNGNNSEIQGDVIVEKDLYLKNVTVTGSVTCGRTLYLGDNVKILGGIYMDNPNNLYGNGASNKTGYVSLTGDKATWINNFNSNTNNYGKQYFPSDKELDEILGNGQKENQIVAKQQDLIDEYSGIGYNKVPEGKDVSTTYNVSDSSIYTKSGQDIVNLTGDTYFGNCASSYDSNSILYITDDCTLSGGIIGNKLVYINPGNKDIWVKLNGLSFTDYAYLVVNSNCTGSVNFFLADNEELNVYKGSLMTSYYFDIMKNDKGMAMVSNTTDKYKIPNINIYSGENTKITVNNGQDACITAYILAPKAHLQVPSNASPVSNFGTVTYNGQIVDSSFGVTVIGSAIVNSANLTNKDGIFFISQDSNGNKPENTGDEELTVLKAYYQNS